jgi:hypothetical protein
MEFKEEYFEESTSAGIPGEYCSSQGLSVFINAFVGISRINLTNNFYLLSIRFSQAKYYENQWIDI